jgi:hypothetical protein
MSAAETILFLQQEKIDVGTHGSKTVSDETVRQTSADEHDVRFHESPVGHQIA